MNDLINMLQTIALVLTLIIVILALGWIVYAFGKFAAAFEELLKTLKQPQISVHTSTVSAAAPVPVQEPVVVADPVEAKRYPCAVCKCRLPEVPTHSVIKEDITLLVYKCRRCGKETEVDPEKTKPVQPK